MQRRWKVTLVGVVLAVAAAGLSVLLVLLRRWTVRLAGVVTAVANARLSVLPVLLRRWTVRLTGVVTAAAAAGLSVLLALPRRWTVTLAGAVTIVVATGLSVLLALPQSAARPVVQKHEQERIVPVMHLAHMPVRPLPDPVPTQLVSPFTGKPVKVLGRVLVVKIDNIVDARPPENLTSADLVYLLPVEGGLSRIFAVYSSHIPDVIGPVRSAREDDLELLAQFGRPGFAYSGATPHLIPFIARARVVNLYALDHMSAYFRDGYRVAPHNLFAYGKVLRAEMRRASTARDIGFRFGPAPPGGRRTTSFTVSYPAATFTFRWWPRTHRWLVWMDGRQATDAAGGNLGAATVIIQYTDVRTSRFLEYGFRPPDAKSTGSGTAVVLRDGRAWRVHWSRPNQDSGTTYTLPSGARMTFAPGQEWVVLTTTDWAHAGL